MTIDEKKRRMERLKNHLAVGLDLLPGDSIYIEEQQEGTLKYRVSGKREMLISEGECEVSEIDEHEPVEYVTR